MAMPPNGFKQVLTASIAVVVTGTIMALSGWTLTSIHEIDVRLARMEIQMGQCRCAPAATALTSEGK